MTEPAKRSADGLPATPAPWPADRLETTGATVRYRVRFDECGSDGHARAGSYLRWAQEIAWVHSDGVGFDRAWYAERDLMWLVRGIELEILEPSDSGEIVELTTRLTGFRRVWARRETEIRAADRRLIGRVHTDWVMTDAVRGLPVRVPADLTERLGLDLPAFEPTRIELPETPGSATSIDLLVGPRDLDPMGHVNNAVYLDWLDEAARAVVASPDGRSTFSLPITYRLEYLAATPPRTELTASAWKEDGGRIVCRIVGPGGVDHLRGSVLAG